METPLNTAESTLFSSIHGMLIIIHMLGYKRMLNQFQNIEILQNVSYGHNGITFEINKSKGSPYKKS